MLRLAARRASIVALVPHSRPGGGLEPAEFAIEPFERRIAQLDIALAEVAPDRPPPDRSTLVFEMYDSVNSIEHDWISALQHGALLT